jgi:hypothetical protein
MRPPSSRPDGVVFELQLAAAATPRPSRTSASLLRRAHTAALRSARSSDMPAASESWLRSARRRPSG